MSEMSAAAKDYLECLAASRCPACREVVDGKQVGRCVYCEKCGHRMYQGRVMKKRKKT